MSVIAAFPGVAALVWADIQRVSVTLADEMATRSNSFDRCFAADLRAISGRTLEEFNASPRPFPEVMVAFMFAVKEVPEMRGVWAAKVRSLLAEWYAAVALSSVPEVVS